jgi:D-alanyl-D-alanine carboxypeptidase
MALLTRALIREFPTIPVHFETQAIQVDARTLNNHNRLLGRFQGADGMKTGYTCSSGFNLAASATRNGRRLVAIVLGGSSAQQRNEIAASLLEAGFRRAGGFRLFSRPGPD